MDFTVRRIEASDQTQEFDCGNASLNDFLRNQARQLQRRMFGVTYVAVSLHHSPNKVIGYFTLANTSIPRDGLPEELLKKAPRYQHLPAFLLGQLAVDKVYQGKQIGELLLSKCMEQCIAISKCSGARYLVTEAKDSAVTWYERYNFRRIPGGLSPVLTKMFVDLQVVKSAQDAVN
jgi:GNAT superfamily N-acetyltransferase